MAEFDKYRGVAAVSFFYCLTYYSFMMLQLVSRGDAMKRVAARGRHGVDEGERMGESFVCACLAWFPILLRLSEKCNARLCSVVP